MIEEALWTRLVASAGVGDRVYPVALPVDAELPAVTYQRISTERIGSHDGPTGLVMGRFQLTAWGRTFAEARTVARAVRGGVAGRGTLGLQTSVLDAGEADFRDAESGWWQSPVDVTILYAETGE